DYAYLAFATLGDRVPMWATLNEPWVITDGGYLHGSLAPGHRNLFEAPLASHHLLLAHAKAVQASRSMRLAKVGIVVNLEPKDPASRSRADHDAANRADGYMNRQYLDPIFFGRYPAELAEIFGEAWPDFPARDLELIRQPIDFLGVNYYTRGVMRHDPAAPPLRASHVRQRRARYTQTGWEVHPQSLTRVLQWVAGRYGPLPLYVT